MGFRCFIADFARDAKVSRVDWRIISSLPRKITYARFYVFFRYITHSFYLDDKKTTFRHCATNLVVLNRPRKSTYQTENPIAAFILNSLGCLSLRSKGFIRRLHLPLLPLSSLPFPIIRSSSSSSFTHKPKHQNQKQTSPHLPSFANLAKSASPFHM